MVYYPRRLWNMEHVCFSLSWPIITTHPNSGLNYNQFQKHDKYFCHSPKIEEAQTYCGLTKLIDEPNIQPATDAWRRTEDIWRRVIQFEINSWPVEGEEISKWIIITSHFHKSLYLTNYNLSIDATSCGLSETLSKL